MIFVHAGLYLIQRKAKMKPHFIYMKRFEVPDICGKGGNKERNQNTQKNHFKPSSSKRRKREKYIELVPSRLYQL